MSFLQVLGLLGIALLLLPAMIVARSREVTGTKKIAWFAFTLVFSWIGYIFYRTLATDRKGSGTANDL